MAKLDRSSDEWKRIRKQLLALVDRVNKRINRQALTDKNAQHELYVKKTLLIIKKNTSQKTFGAFMNACKSRIPMLNATLD